MMKRLGARLASAGGDFVGKTMLCGHLQADVTSGDGLGPTGEGFIVQAGVLYRPVEVLPC